MPWRVLYRWYAWAQLSSPRLVFRMNVPLSWCACSASATSTGTRRLYSSSLCVGVDDEGKPFPLKNEKELLQFLPTKIRDQLGLIADVNLVETPEGDYIRIDVPHSDRQVSYRGHFYYRSGSTAMEVTGYFQQIHSF